MSIYPRGGSVSGVSVGEFTDWDIPSSGSGNTSDFNSSSRVIYQIGTGANCISNNRRFGGIALLGMTDTAGCIDTSASPHGALTERNSTYVYPTSGLVASEAYQLMSQVGWSALGSSTDQFSLMTFYFDRTINVGETLKVYVALTTVRDSTSQMVVENVTKARKWFADRLLQGCVPTCCNGDGIRGNVDDIVGVGGEVDVADLTYLVAFLFQAGAAPPCVDEGNVDGITGPGGPFDVADLTYLVAYLFQGGGTPPVCP
jgi:hypothetical protein